MPDGLNKVMLIGNLGRDPEMRYTANGTAVSTFSVAVNRTTRGPDGDRRDETQWFRVVTWEKLAELVGQHLTKGRKVYVEGRLNQRSWDDQQGQKHEVTEVVATQVLFLDRPQGATMPDMGGDVDMDDVPFS
jgi:single-strand DNA-binding protein